MRHGNAFVYAAGDPDATESGDEGEQSEADGDERSLGGKIVDEAREVAGKIAQKPTRPDDQGKPPWLDAIKEILTACHGDAQAID